MERQEYYFVFETYQESKNISTNCIDITFINRGTLAVKINNYTLRVGETIGFTGNFGEIIKKPINLIMSAPIGENQVDVIKRVYTS